MPVFRCSPLTERCRLWGEVYEAGFLLDWSLFGIVCRLAGSAQRPCVCVCVCVCEREEGESGPLLTFVSEVTDLDARFL